ncbi:MAG: hypothetical protein ACI936_000502 [Paraglaciecola sp.]|jgi:hypothetical protein
MLEIIVVLNGIDFFRIHFWFSLVGTEVVIKMRTVLLMVLWPLLSFEIIRLSMGNI